MPRESTAEGLGVWATASSAQVSCARPGCQLSSVLGGGSEATQSLCSLGTRRVRRSRLPAGAGPCCVHEAELLVPLELFESRGPVITHLPLKQRGVFWQLLLILSYFCPSKTCACCFKGRNTFCFSGPSMLVPSDLKTKQLPGEALLLEEPDLDAGVRFF